MKHFTVVTRDSFQRNVEQHAIRCNREVEEEVNSLRVGDLLVVTQDYRSDAHDTHAADGVCTFSGGGDWMVIERTA